MSKFSDLKKRMRKDARPDTEKQVELEKGDFKALMIAAFEVFGPVLIGMLAFFCILILILVFLWT